MKSLRRLVRYNGLVERAQQIVRQSRTLSLAQIGLQLDIAPSDVLIDCGANVGDVTSSFARTGAMVFAFEPNPLCFAILKRRFVASPNVVLFQNGVMDRECYLDLVYPKAHAQWDDVDATIAGSFTHRREVDSESTRVRCIDLSDFVHSLKQPVRLIKMDIEGSEIQVLNRLIDSGAISKVELLVVETHEKQQPELLRETLALRRRLEQEDLTSKVRLDWI